MVRLFAFGAISALSLVGCTHPDSGGVTLNASGSTFQKAFQEVAIDEFQKSHPSVRVNYGGGGSGKGRQDFADRVVDFACTDAPFKAEDLAKVKGGELLYFPTLLGAIAIGFNLDGVTTLNLSPDVIAKIFQLEITKWNDPAIAADNPGVALPDEDITVAHRSDGSGTTENFTKYLVKAAPETWKLKAGATVEWPADMEAGAGNSGVAQILMNTEGSIAYIDLSDAKASGLKVARIKNRNGKLVEPTPASVAAAGDGIEVDAKLLFSAVNAPGDAAYPITAQSWCIAYANQTDHVRGTAVKDYFRYMLADAQPLLGEIDFAPLPRSLQDKALAQLERMTVP